VARYAAQDEQVGQDIDHVDGREPPADADRQTLVRELVHQVQHPVLAAIMGAILDEVVGPYVIGILWPQPDAGPVRQPQSPPFRLLTGYFEPLAPPDPLHPAIAHRPARLTQQGSNLAIAIAAVLPSQFNDVGRQSFGIVTAPRDLALCRAVLPERRTSATLGDMQLRTNVLDAGAPTRGA